MASPSASIAGNSSLSPHPVSAQEISPALPPTDPKPQDPFADLFTSSSENDDFENFTNSATSTTTLSTFLAASTPSAIPPPIPPPTAFDENNNASPSFYFNFFLSELRKCFPYVDLFPWTAATMFSSSNHNPALRESVLAVAALTNKEQGQEEALNHLQRALQLIRDKISTVEVDEGIAISSFLLSHFSMMLGDHVTAKKHLKGMLVVLQKLEQSHGTRKDGDKEREGVPNPLRMDELTMLIWRMAIRIDFISSIASGQHPILPESPLLVKFPCLW